MAYRLGLLKMVRSFSKHQSVSIVNKPINSGIVPEEMTFARVRYIFKKNSPLDASNYRPVSILSIVSKIIERSIST